MSIELTKQAIDLGIVTTNGPAMLAFYRDVLGLKYLREMPMPIGSGVM
nr:VOC family protein [Pseudomonas sp.]